MRQRIFDWKVDGARVVEADRGKFATIRSPRARNSRISLGATEVTRLLNSDPMAAEARALESLRADPDDSDAAWLLGAALQRQGRHEQARAMLEPLTASQPQMAAAWYELGTAFAALGERAKAIDALLRAVDLEPFDRHAWYKLGDLLTFPQRAGANTEHPDLRLAEAGAALHAGQRARAETILRGLLDVQPEDARAMKLLADVMLAGNRWDEFKTLAGRCLELEPGFAAARFRYVAMRLSRRDVRGLLPQVETLVESDPGNALYRTLKALALLLDRRFHDCIVEFEGLLAEEPWRPGLWLSYARALRAVKNDKAISACKRAIQLLPGYSKAYMSIANAKLFRIDEDLIGQLQTRLALPGLPAEDRARLHYVLGRAYEDEKRYPESFDHYRRSNEILRGGENPGTGKSGLYVHYAKEVFTPAFFRERAGFGCPDSAPIFIVGMPRSGSTLIEQILSSHSAVEALGELYDLTEIGKRFVPERIGDPQGRYPYALRSLDAGRIRLLGEEYIRTAARRRSLDTRFFTDKMPGNYTHAGLIHLALPNARIIDMRRHPLDCCFSCFKHYFPDGMPDAMDLGDIGRAYVNYVELMAHFDAVRPGRVHRIFYENLIDDFEAEVRRLLDHLGLPFEEQCLRFHENRRLVLTLSADQVVTPLYRSGVGSWRRYETWLDPLKHALGDVLDAYPAVPKFYPAVHVHSKSPRSLGHAGRRYAFVNGLRQVPFGTP